MCYEIILTPKFEEDLNFYEKKKKFKHIEDDVEIIIEELEQGNLVGEKMYDIKSPDGEDTYKVRTVNTDTKSGKSNGYRIIYYVIKDDRSIFLLTIYYKKDDKRVPTKQEIKDLIERYVN